MDVPDKRMEPQYLVHVMKFIAVAKAHRQSLDQTTTICLCSHCKNMKAHANSDVQSHLIRFGCQGLHGLDFSWRKGSRCNCG
jgi:hypothetical protein